MTNNSSRRVAVILGGESAEHDISLLTGQAVISALSTTSHRVFPVKIERDGRWVVPDADGHLDANGGGVSPAEGLARLTQLRPDVVFIALHGPNGEDGTLQGALEILHLPYTGSGVLASSLANDKLRTKTLLGAVGLRVCRHVAVSKNQYEAQPARVLEDVQQGLDFPVFVKPVHQGSSVGAGVAQNNADLQRLLTVALAHDSEALVEEWLVGRELTVPVIDDPETGQPRCLPLVEIRPIGHDFFDYTAKYTAGHNEEICPAPLPDSISAEIAAVGLLAHQALGCRGVSRTDVMLTDRGIYVIEVNTLPGLTEESLLPKAAREANIEFVELVSGLIECGIRAR